MRKVYELDGRDIAPTPMEILLWQKMPEHSVPPGIARLMNHAIELFQDLAQPRGLVEGFGIADFPDIYKGKGMNAPDGPIPSIVARADAAAFMAATMGDTLSEKCSELFAHGRAALGYMLNVVSSIASELLGRRMCHIFLERLRSKSHEVNDIKVQYYCPGHCGWHISGQEKLFTALCPDEIGILLDANWVMRPFKSISGIMVAAPIETHRFTRGFSFCPQCMELKCVERLKLLEAD